jgi:hypothetical protein
MESGESTRQALIGSIALSFVIPSEAEGSAVSADPSWKCFQLLGWIAYTLRRGGLLWLIRGVRLRLLNTDCAT